MTDRRDKQTASGLMQSLRRRRFKVDITVVFCSLIIPTVIIISAFTYYKTVNATLQIANSLIDKVTSAVIEKTTNYLKPAQVLSQIAPMIVKNPGMEVAFDSELEKLCIEILKLQPQIDLFYYGTENGSFLQAYSLSEAEPISTKWIDRSISPPLVHYRHRDLENNVVEETMTTDVKYDPRVRPWYQGAKKTMGTFWTDLYIFHESGKPGITVATPVVSDADTLLGVVAADITLDGISSFLRGLDVSKNGVVFIIDENYRFVAFPDPDRMVKIDGGKIQPLRAMEIEEKWIADGIRQYESSGQSHLTYVSDGEKYFARLTPFPETFGKKWTIAVMLPENDFLGVIRETSITIILISVAILIASVAFGLLFARNLSRPIEQLTNELRLVRDFDLEKRTAITSYVNEIQTMADAVESMKNGLKSFRQYVPADLVRQLIASGNEALPGGKEIEITLFFSDIANFTTIAEKLPARELMIDLSEYFEVMTRPIAQQQGTVDKFIGDAVMAFWGAPRANDMHAVCACRAALQSQQAVAKLNETRAATGNPSFNTRIGIHTGFTIVGNMGSNDRLNYTALGDNVNLASRLEGVNKRYGTKIIISQETYRYVRKEFILRPLDLVAVKGRSSGVMIYELMGEMDAGEQQSLRELAASFQGAFELYLGRSWQKALDQLNEIHQRFPEDQPTLMYIERCQNLLDQDPGPDWSGIIRLNRGDFQ